jgi:hypothetical protein
MPLVVTDDGSHTGYARGKIDAQSEQLWSDELIHADQISQIRSMARFVRCHGGPFSGLFAKRANEQDGKEKSTGSTIRLAFAMSNHPVESEVPVETSKTHLASWHG